MSPPLRHYLGLWGLELVGLAGQGEGREPYAGVGGVAFVRRGGADLVLKLLPEAGDEARSAAVLAHWDGRGAARLLDAAPGAILIERALPGDDLAGLVDAGRDDEAAERLCEVMAALDRPPPADASFRTVADWGAGFGRVRLRALAAGVEAALIDEAESLYFDLARSQADPILLHGDLQHYNVVRDAARGWLAIDPKGILGEPAFETGAMLRNPSARPDLFTDPQVIEQRVRRICAGRGFERRRVLGWCFSQCVLSALWGVEDRGRASPSVLSAARAVRSLW